VFIGGCRRELERTEAGRRITLMRANLSAQLGNENLPAIAAECVGVSR